MIEQDPTAPMGSAPVGIAARAHVMACSPFVEETLERNPGMLEELDRSGALKGVADPDYYRARLRSAVAGCADEPALMHGLRQARQREMVRIAWRDLAGLAPVAETLADLTHLADACICEALSHLYRWQCASQGTPTSSDGEAQQLVVVALGKLGSRELNFSSDIDLLFCYPKVGVTVGAREVSNEKFFLRLGRRLINVLSERTEDGFVYRVDMRLRPFGQSGALVAHFDALEDYYQSFGRDWERFAFLRARVVAGDFVAGRSLLERLHPFIYRRYLDFAALQSLREVKEMISQDLDTQAGDPERGDIKRGRGAIREIEFIVQSVQLLRGGAVADLRGGTILDLLKAIAARGLLPAPVTAELELAYVFLRRVENHLQAVRDQQTHSLPKNEVERSRLARSMGFSGWDHFHRDCQAHRDRVRTHFEAVLGGSDTAGSADLYANIWSSLDTRGRDSSEVPTATAELLARVGFGPGAQCAERLWRLRQNYRTRTLGERGQRRLGALIPALLEEIAGTANPPETLNRTLEVIESILQRAAYLALLTERRVALTQLVRLCAASPWLANHLAHHPQAFDELLDPRTLYAPPEREELVRTLDARLAGIPAGDVEAEMDALRYFQQASTLRVAAAEVSGAIALMVVSDRLSEIAETCLARVLELAWDELVSRHGEPTFELDGARRVAPFGIVAYGKLGGIELSYGSDLDLVFLHGSEGEQQITDGKRVVDNVTFFARLGQRIIHWLATHTPAGRLYEVDSRLRPSGASGLLVSSMDAFESYQRNDAWTWEHQALVRARWVAGDPELGKRFAGTRRAILATPRDGERLKSDVREMRLRMQQELGSKPGEPYHLKQDPGGIADIEFLVQYGVLRWAERLGETLQYTDNVRLLEGFSAHGILPADDAAALTDAYRAYRSRVHELDLQELPARVDPDEFSATRALVEKLWRQWMD